MNRKLTGTAMAMATLGLLACSGDGLDPPTLAGSGSGGGGSGGSPPGSGGTPNSAGSPNSGGGTPFGGSIAGGAAGAAKGGASNGGSGGGSAAGSAGRTSGAGNSGAATGGKPAAMGGMPAFGGGGGVMSGGAAGATGTGGAADSARSPGCGKAAGKTGAFQAQMSAFNLERSYFLSVPQSYDPATPHALIFGYHGSNYTGQRMRSYLDLEKAPLAGKAIFVYPDGLPLSDQPDHVAWELNEGSRDLVFFDELSKKLSDEYCVDLSRLFVNGQSYGGLMTNAVGCLRGDVVRAIAVVAGSGPRGSTCKGQVAVWLTHGTDDESVSYASGEKSRDTWASANHCMQTTQPGTPTQCLEYQGCDAGHPVIWCPHTNDSGHQHPSFGKAAVRNFFAQF